MSNLFYKVVRVFSRASKEYFSLYYISYGYEAPSINSKEGKDWILKYRLNKVTRPKIGSIFAFGTLKDASSFVYRIARFGMILEGEGDASAIQRREHVISTRDKAKEFWMHLTSDYPTMWAYSNTESNPQGTILLDCFKPLREVDCNGNTVI